MTHQWAPICAGEIIIPTDTKKMAPKRSLIGDISFIIFSFSMVSASMEPIIKAPSADEKPEAVARDTIPKHRPRLMMSRISSLRYLLVLLSRVGMT